MSGACVGIFVPRRGEPFRGRDRLDFLECALTQ
jgi:hypothetical protein